MSSRRRGRWIPSYAGLSRGMSMAAASSMKLTPTVAHPGAMKMAAAASLTFTGQVTRLAVVQFTADELLDLEVTPRRVESFRFDVLDPESNVLGQLAVTNESTPQITLDTSRRIRRELSGVVIPPRTAQTVDSTLFFSGDIDTQNHRIKVWHVLGDGGEGYEYPMGVFVFSADPARIRTYGNTIDATLADLSQIFDQQVLDSVTFNAGTNAGTALATLFDAAGLTATIEPTSVTFGEPVTMVALQDSRQSTADVICQICGFLPPYFDNNGTGVCRSTPDYTATTPTLTYGTGSRAHDGSITETSSLLLAPNVWIAEASSGTADAIIGRYELDADDPHSIASIGYAIPEKVDVQGIDTQTAADDAARAAGQASRKRLRHRHWTSPIDSRHDTFDAIGWDTETDLELSWSCDLVPGGTMTHDTVILG